MSTLTDIEKGLHSGDSLWQFRNGVEQFMQRSVYPAKKAVTITASGAEPVATLKKHRKPSIYHSLLPYFDEMASLYSHDVRAQAERYLRDKMTEFATSGGAKYLGLSQRRVMDVQSVLKMAAFLLDKPELENMDLFCR
jgi:hypothetical protein